MATTTTARVAHIIRARIASDPDITLQSAAECIAAQTGLAPRTIREHLTIGSLSVDELIAAAATLGTTAHDLLAEGERSVATHSTHSAA